MPAHRTGNGIGRMNYVRQWRDLYTARLIRKWRMVGAQPRRLRCRTYTTVSINGADAVNAILPHI
jgi:hypothetical protein